MSMEVEIMQHLSAHCHIAMLSMKMQMVSILRWNYVLGTLDHEISRDGKLIKVLIMTSNTAVK